jgi:hypothetical protein
VLVIVAASLTPPPSAPTADESGVPIERANMRSNPGHM